MSVGAAGGIRAAALLVLAAARCVAGFAAPISLSTGLTELAGLDRAAPACSGIGRAPPLRGVGAPALSAQLGGGGLGDMVPNLAGRLRQAASKVATSRAADTATLVRDFLDRGEAERACKALVAGCLQGAIAEDDMVGLWRRTELSAEAIASSFEEGARLDLSGSDVRQRVAQANRCCCAALPCDPAHVTSPAPPLALGADAGGAFSSSLCRG